MELQDLAGRVYKFSGIERGFEPPGSNSFSFILNDLVYTAVEDPEDGYRSSMKKIIVSNASTVTVSNKFEPVEVFASMGGGVLELTDIQNGETILRVGTDYEDDYYPVFVAEFMPGKMTCNSKGANMSGVKNIQFTGNDPGRKQDLVIELDSGPEEFYINLGEWKHITKGAPNSLYEIVARIISIYENIDDEDLYQVVVNAGNKINRVFQEASDTIDSVLIKKAAATKAKEQEDKLLFIRDYSKLLKKYGLKLDIEGNLITKE